MPGTFDSQLWQQMSLAKQPHERVSTGCKPLDDVLPAAQAASGANLPRSNIPGAEISTGRGISTKKGISRGSLVEWFVDGPGNAATLFATIAAREAARDGGLIVFIDRANTFYPPAAAALGIDLHRTLIVRPDSEKHELWAIDQVLRCAHVAVAVSWPKKIDSITFRRFQLAAERSGCLGMLVRPSSASREPSWADLRVSVSPCGIACDSRAHWRIDLKILRCRGNARKEVIQLQIDDRTVFDLIDDGRNP